MLWNIWLKSSGHQVTLLTHGTNVHLHLSAAEFLPPAFHSKGRIAVTCSQRPLQMSGGWGQRKMLPQDTPADQQGKEDVRTNRTHHFHTVAETGSSCSYSHGKTLPSGHSQTQGPGHTVSNRQQLASVLGTPVMKDSTIEGAITQHRHPELYWSRCWPSLVLSPELALFLSPVLAFCGS